MSSHSILWLWYKINVKNLNECYMFSLRSISSNIAWWFGDDILYQEYIGDCLRCFQVNLSKSLQEFLQEFSGNPSMASPQIPWNSSRSFRRIPEAFVVELLHDLTGNNYINYQKITSSTSMKFTSRVPKKSSSNNAWFLQDFPRIFTFFSKFLKKFLGIKSSTKKSGNSFRRSSEIHAGVS